MHPEFDYRYFAVKDDSGTVCAVQPFFILDQDLLVGASRKFRAIDRQDPSSVPGFMR